MLQTVISSLCCAGALAVQSTASASVSEAAAAFAPLCPLRSVLFALPPDASVLRTEVQEPPSAGMGTATAADMGQELTLTEARGSVVAPPSHWLDREPLCVSRSHVMLCAAVLAAHIVSGLQRLLHLLRARRARKLVGRYQCVSPRVLCVWVEQLGACMSVNLYDWNV